MRALAVWLLLAAVSGAQGGVGGGVRGLPQPPPRDPRAAPVTGTGSISGRITAVDTGAPMRRAVVNLGGPQRMRATYTDHEGRYEFQNLPPGTYNLFANPGPHRPGYQPAGYGASPLTLSVGMRSKPIELADGQRIENLDVALARTGVITGRVTDPYGEPIARVQVGAWILRPGAEPGQTSGAQTDDLGQFRLFGLAPGDYMVMANPQIGGGGQTEIEGEPVGFAPTYAPGTPVRAEALRLRLARGGEASADIRLVETRVYSISGQVMTSNGDPARNTNVMLMRGEGSGGPTFGTSVSPAGAFTMRNVPPGQYEVIARHAPPREPGTVVQGPDPGQEFASVTVDVTAGDVAGVVLVTRPGAVVTGEIVFDETPPESRRVNLFAQPTGRMPMTGAPAVEAKDTTFTMRGLFGPILIRGSMGGGPAWGLKAVLLRGKDITDEPTTFTAADTGHLQVVFTAKAPAIEGVVTDETGKPVTEASIVLFGHDRTTWQARSSYYRMSRVVKEGRYTVMGLREGRYYAIAVPPELMMNIAQPSAEMLESLSKVATAVTLNPGEKRTVDLTLVRFQEQ